MLRIRSEQIRPFEPQAEVAFICRVMEYLRKHHSDAEVLLPNRRKVNVANLKDEVLHEMVMGGIARAKQYGLSWASNLISFVVLMFIVAPNFDEDERAGKTLKSEEIEVEQRVDELLDELTDEEWNEIAERYDAETWQLPIETKIVEEITV